MTPVRVVVADDSLLIRQGVVGLFELTEGLEVVGQAGDLPSLLALVDELRPDVVVTDIRMPPTNTTEGIDAARLIRQSSAEVGVIVLSQHADPGYVTMLFEGGSDGLGYLLKERIGDVDELESAVHVVAAGGSVVDPKLVHVMVRQRVRPERPGVDGLTPRESDVLELIAEGLNNAAIAARLVLSEKAVSKHINSIFSKLGLGDEPDAHRRVKAVLMWLARA